MAGLGPISGEAVSSTLAHWLMVGLGESESGSHETRDVSYGDCTSPGARAIPMYMHPHHATVNGFSGQHLDHMGLGIEDKVALGGVGKANRVPLPLEMCGSTQALPASACAFSSYRVATLLSSAGPSRLNGR